MSEQRVVLAVSTVIFALRPHPTTGRPTLWLPLVRRIREPYRGQWALPGGPLQPEDDLATSARRTLERTTGLDPHYLEQLYAFGAVDRSACGDGPGSSERVVSVVYWAIIRPDEAARAVDGDNVEWRVADDVVGRPDGDQPEPLAFDHGTVLRYALARLRAKIGYSPIAYAFLTDEFTLAALREVHEAVLQRPLDPANFRRQVLASQAVAPTGRHLTGTSHRPPALYRRVVAIPSADPSRVTAPADPTSPTEPDTEECA
ncbi:NUDIX hydrolase [Auraticoccus monumenti]|uniref:8-oxo-dGTP diphosphatase n=1 Tax=Auraticoccus monumenti TaxID=675864 RepID=A0A1G6V3E5_9ACTN|nr:NUDIX domain-containing protein [Auraticoccus monumenti]SDD47487.1 8-oxo-dGTP diphosphatase [Auraticoccus monumenti]